AFTLNKACTLLGSTLPPLPSLLEPLLPSGSSWKPNRIRGVASEDFATTAALKTDTEDKLKLGGSELKVTRLGIGAWSWGDTSYWNNFQWD
ncbi:hypothetical protein Godav_000318, partial [Gossypium davidsonii]|nr:hypothetical protein [Gossypium davidsonii]